MDLQRIEIELKKRLPFPYSWGKMQSDSWDKKTNFIYKTYSFETLIKRTVDFDKPLKDYALNRWYNYWSAMAAEDIFNSHEIVSANKNKFDKLVDFRINNIPFDHKTSVFPKGFNKSYNYALKNKTELINWLYENQSQEGRKHLKNRLFIILYDNKTQKHWQLKSEILILKKAINDYINNFYLENLTKLNFGKDEILSDIIWVTNKK